MNTIVLARHGETDFNVQRLFRGRADPPLNARGVAQVLLQGDAIAQMRPDIVFSSPRLRAKQTAEAIAHACNTEFQLDQDLDDIDYGLWTGKSHQQVADRWPDEWKDFGERPETFTFPQGECMGVFILPPCPPGGLRRHGRSRSRGGG